MWRRPVCQTQSKALDISSATARVSPSLLKALAILSDATARRSAVYWEDLKPYWKWEKGHISLGEQQSYYLQVTILLFAERRLTAWYFLTVDLSPAFLNTGTTDETF